MGVVCEVINNSKQVMKGTAKARASANKEYASLSNVLKQIKEKKMWSAGFGEAFAGVGITDAKDLTPALFRSLAPEVCAKDKKGKKQLAIWGMAVVKDADGMPALDAEGAIVYTPVQRIVKAWTPNKVLQILAQSAAFRAQASQADAPATEKAA